MATNYSSWTLDKLKKEIQKIERVIKVKETRDKKATLVKLATVARKSGFELHELIGVSADGNLSKSSRADFKSTSRQTCKTRKRGKVAPKYRNPENVRETWTGRGRQPIWVRIHLENGGSLGDIAIEAREPVLS